MGRNGQNLGDYRSWSFWNRSFLVGLVFSLLWHFFWFFSIKIVIEKPRKIDKPVPALVSLGPVMDDELFKTLVETRPQLSQSFYRRPSDLLAAADLPVETVERHAAAGIVSVPFGKQFVDSMNRIVGGMKLAPDFGWAPKTGLWLPGETEEERKKRLEIARESGE